LSSVQTPDAHSLPLSQAAPSPHVGLQVGAAHLKLTQLPAAHSALTAHWVPVPHVGAQLWAAHFPALQLPDAQLPPFAHMFPSGQFIMHDPGPHMSWPGPIVGQIPDAQSLAEPHALPVVHVGEHVGGAHLPPAQMPDAQSVPALQSPPSRHIGLQAGAAHWSAPAPFAAQTPDAHSLPTAHGVLSPHPGAQLWATHWLLVHVSEAHSVLLSQGLPSPHVGVHAGAAHSMLLQLFEAQLAPLVHALPIGHSLVQLMASWPESPPCPASIGASSWPSVVTASCFGAESTAASCPLSTTASMWVVTVPSIASDGIVASCASLEENTSLASPAMLTSTVVASWVASWPLASACLASVPEASWCVVVCPSTCEVGEPSGVDAPHDASSQMPTVSTPHPA